MAQRKSLSERIAELESVVEKRLGSDFAMADIPYPPAYLTLVICKEEKILEIHAGQQPDKLKLIKTMPVLAASGHLGPKLRDKDRQIPEGIYAIDFLNPNSLYHLSLKLNYPNDFDRLKAQADSRFSPGNNIMIHGNQVSSGCIAIGDEPVEDLFVLAHRVGLKNIKVIISPLDFRSKSAAGINTQEKLPDWAPELYEVIEEELKKL